MAVTAYWYGNAFNSAFNPASSQGMTLSSDTIRVLLASSSYSTSPPLTAQTTHQYKSSITGEPPTATGYTAGGATLASKVATFNAATKVWSFDAADVTWSSATISVNYAVVYDDTPSSKPLLAVVDFGGTQSSAGGDFQIVWAASGILSVTVS